jgi:hypothetical protein
LITAKILQTKAEQLVIFVRLDIISSQQLRYNKELMISQLHHLKGIGEES